MSTELGTRIEGINLSLRNLEAELNEKRDFTADQLDSLLSRLDILVLRQKDLTLFRDLIAPQEQAKVGQIDSSRSGRRHHGHPHRRTADPHPRKRGAARGRADCRAEASGRAFRSAGHADGGEVGRQYNEMSSDDEMATNCERFISSESDTLKSQRSAFSNLSV